MLYTFTAGIEFNALGMRMSPRVVNASIARVRELLVDWAGGFTETRTHGGWRGLDGTIVMEKGIRWDVSRDTDDGMQASELAQLIAAALTQASVMLTSQDVAVRFVEG